MPKQKSKTDAPIHGVAVDQGSGLAASLRQARGAAARDSDLFDFKRCVVEALSPEASMLLVDADYGRELLPYYHPACEKLLAYEADVCHIAETDRITVLPRDLSVADYAGLGVERLKFFLYYAPRGGEALNERKRALVRQIGAACAERGLAFLFEPLVYDEALSDRASLDFARFKPELVRSATETFADPSFGVDILKVEIPVNLAFVEGFGSGEISREQALRAIREAAAAAQSIPIVYLSAGVSFEWFEASLALAREAGVQAAGFMCGRAIWQDGIEAFGRGGPAALTAWLESEGVTRLGRLKEAS